MRLWNLAIVLKERQACSFFPKTWLLPFPDTLLFGFHF